MGVFKGVISVGVAVGGNEPRGAVGGNEPRGAFGGNEPPVFGGGGGDVNHPPKAGGVDVIALKQPPHSGFENG